MRGRFLARTAREPAWVLFWLTVSAVVAIAGQALFLLWMKRSFGGYHYFTLLTPFYAVVPAALLWVVAPSRIRSPVIACALGCVVVAMLVWQGPRLADRFLERSPWTYARIRAAVDSLCGNGASQPMKGRASPRS